MRTIFTAGRQLWKVWFVVLVSLACGGALVWLGGYLFTSLGLHPTEGGVLRPLPIRLLWGGVSAAAGGAVIAGILAYLQCYVARIEADEPGGGFRITVAGVGPALAVRPDDVALGYDDGISNAGGIGVNAPWYSLRLRGRRLPLIIDLQGEFLDEHAVDRLMEGEPARRYG